MKDSSPIFSPSIYVKAAFHQHAYYSTYPLCDVIWVFPLHPQYPSRPTNQPAAALTKKFPTPSCCIPIYRLRALFLYSYLLEYGAPYCTMATMKICSDTTAAIKEISPKLRREYATLLTQLLTVYNNTSSTARASLKRDDLCDQFNKILLGSNASTSRTLQMHLQYALFEREAAHIRMARMAMIKAAVKYECGSDNEPHDHSKDIVFIVLVGAYFSFFSDEEIKTSLGVAMQDATNMELSRHYRLESHHPEHERYTNSAIPDAYVLEMAVDRMCRSLQFNDLQYGQDLLTTRWLPVFNTNDGRLDRYKEYVADFRDELRILVRDHFLTADDERTALLTARDQHVPPSKQQPIPTPGYYRRWHFHCELEDVPIY